MKFAVKAFTTLVTLLALWSSAIGRASLVHSDFPGENQDGALVATASTIIDLGRARVGNWNSSSLGHGVFDPRHKLVVFRYNAVRIAAGATVTFSNRPPDADVVWLVDGDGAELDKKKTRQTSGIVNFGQIQLDGGGLYLIAPSVENKGSISVRRGCLGLYGGETMQVGNEPDGREISVGVTTPSGSVENDGKLSADGGVIALNGGAITQKGLIQANSIRDQRGDIELIAADSLNLDFTSKIFATGDATAGGSAGGTITLKAGNIFSDKVGSQIKIMGGTQGGDGGKVEISAQNFVSLNTAMDSTAHLGWQAGSLLLDPTTINLGTTGTGTVPANGTVSSGSTPATLSLNVNTAFASMNFSSITLQATGNINLLANTVWNLSTSTGVSSGSVTLEAGGNITLNSGSSMVDGNGWSINLLAGYNFTQNKVVSGSSSILLNGNSSIQAAAGNISLTAADNIAVGSGFVITTGGGSVNVHALTGGINTGTDAQGYTFIPNATTLASAYSLSGGLGGISTAAGGNVNLTAGGNITSYLPAGATGQAQTETAGAGAYGPAAGNVTVIASGDVVGNYVVANGTGKIYAGVQMDANGNPIAGGNGYLLGSTGNAGNTTTSLALNLINGGWNVTAAQDIILNEVANPNGLYNNVSSAAVQHVFDYGSSDYVNLTAGYQVQLGSQSLARLNITPSPIYPGTLDIISGAGGVLLNGSITYNQLVLFPSPTGGLTINTIGGGSLAGNLPLSSSTPQTFSLVVSDSSSDQYHSTGSFGVNDHAANPIHEGGEVPVQLNISGDMDLVQLDSPEVAQINVVGNMNNSSYQGMNLNAGDTSSITVGAQAKANMENNGILNPATDGSITVGGNITERSAFTSVDLSPVVGAGTPDFSVLPYALPPANLPSGATLAASFYYNAATHILTYQFIPGRASLAQILITLENLTVQVVINGVPQWQDSQHTIPVTTTVSTISPAAANALLAEYNALGPAPLGNAGFIIGGGGQFQVQASSLDLGSTPGIQAQGVGFEQTSAGYPLANLFTTGANIDLNLTGDLTMYSSSIATLNGSSVKINAAGTIDVGSPDFNITATGARGIYTTAQGACTVTAGSDINVNGSRIAAYDGGNVTVESLNGNVSVGTGSNGFVTADSYMVNPVTRAVSLDAVIIPGSGILANTLLSDPTSTAGNITVTAAGNIQIGSAGIVQYSFNGTDGSGSTLDLQTGGIFATNDAILGPGLLTLVASNSYTFYAPQFATNPMVAAAGSDVEIDALQAIVEGDPMTTGCGLGPFTWQWSKNGTNIDGATNAALLLTDVQRADGGTYVAAVSNALGTFTNSISLRVLISQILSAAVAQTNGFITFSFNSADGVSLSAQDIPDFTVETSTDLVDWNVVNLPMGTNSTGGLTFQVPVSMDPGGWFYRIQSE